MSRRPVTLTRRGLLAAGASLAAPAVVRADATLRLRLGHALPSSHPVHAAMEFFAEQVRERTGGGIEIALFANGELGQEVQILEQISAGRLDFAKVSGSVLERIAPVHQIFNLPYLIRDETHWAAVVTSPAGEEILASPIPGCLGLTFYHAGSRNFYARKPIRRPEDLAGLKIRIQPSPTTVRMITLLGAQPIQLPWAATYSALQTGLVDGAENNVSSLVVGRHAEVTKYYSFDEHTMVPDVLIVSEQRWNTLNEAQRAALRGAARASFSKMSVLWAGYEEEARRTAESLGIVFLRPDKAPFIARVMPLRAEFAADPRFRDLIARIERA